MKQSGLHLTTSASAGDPSAFRMEIKISNVNNETKDITQLVDTFRVTESIYQQALIAEATIADGTNFFEDFGVSGNEQFHVTLIKKLDGSSEPVEIRTTFYVMDIPMFARPKPDAQAYTIRLVSPFGLISKMRRVEHVHRGTAVEILEELYRQCGIEYKNVQLKETQDYRGNGNNVFLLVNDKDSSPPFVYIPPKPTYSEAIAQILSKASAANGAPYFAYETFIGGQHILNSYNQMILTEKYDRYYQSSFMNAKALTDEAYEEKRRRILEISSNLGFSPYKGFKDGSYVTRTYAIDWQTKSYILQDFNAFRDGIAMLDNDLVMHPNFSISNSIDYTNTADTHALYYSLNSLAFADRAEVGMHEHMQFVGAQRRAILANLGQITHVVKLNGDPSLTPGRTIELEIPKSGAADTEQRDPDLLLSGRYLIVSANHIFDNDGYSTQLKVARDGVDRGNLAARPVQGQPDPVYGAESTSAPLTQPKQISGASADGPPAGLRGPATSVAADAEVIEINGPVDEAVATATATSDQAAGDTQVATAENEGNITSAYGPAGAAAGDIFNEENLEDELKETVTDRSSQSNTGPQ